MLYLYLRTLDKALALLLKALEKDFVIERISTEEAFIGLKNDRFLQRELGRVSEELAKVEEAKVVANLAPSRFLAKAIAYYPEENLLTRIPFGKISELIFLSWERFSDYLDRLPLDSLWPCPRKVIEALISLGFRTLGSLKEKRREELIQLFEFWGEVLFQLVRGRDFLQLSYNQERKELILTSQFPEGISYGDFFKYLDDSLIVELKKQLKDDLGVMAFSWILETMEGKTLVGERLFSRPIVDLGVLKTNLGLSLIKEDKLKEDIFLFSWTLKDLTPILLQQRTIFVPEERSRGNLEKVMKYLAQRYPDQQVKLGKNLVISRREAKLAWWDPWRFGRESNERSYKSTGSGL